MIWSGAAANLPFIEWSEQFSNKLPNPIIRALRKARGSVFGSIQDNEWRKRLKLQYGDSWKVTRLKPNPEGTETAKREWPIGSYVGEDGTPRKLGSRISEAAVSRRHFPHLRDRSYRPACTERTRGSLSKRIRS